MPDSVTPTPPRKVLLMGTCLSDAFFPDVSKHAFELLEQLGCDVLFPQNQTCCGQPAFNGGDFQQSRKIARHTASVFAGDLPVIVPSGSCAAMHCHGHSLQFEHEKYTEEVQSLADRTWEIFDFIVNELRVTQWPGRLTQRVALHHSCHTRGSRTGAAMRQLLGSIEGIELIEIGQEEQCCGFGGTFSVSFPHLSREIGTLKLDHLFEQKPDVMVSADMSCLMHLGGLAEKQNRLLPWKHALQLLAEAQLSAPLIATD